MASFSFLITAGIIIIITTTVFQQVYDAQPNPFIDEKFHIPQAQKFCYGAFHEWDSKITTLPGLYISSAIISAPFALFNIANTCTTWGLRFINVFYNTCNIFLIYCVMKQINHKSTKSTKDIEDAMEQKLQLASLSTGIFPPLYFFSFLYYTDPGSTFAVLAAYYACLLKRHFLASILGFIAIVFRQTNVIWVVFMAGTVVADYLDSLKEIRKVSASPELKDKLARFLAQLTATLIRYLLVLGNIQQLVLLIWPYLLVVALFGGFVFLNDGIVVGDRSSHQPVINSPQMLYFAGFTLFFSAPLLFSLDKFWRFLHTLKKKSIYFAIFGFLCVYVVLNNSHVHPYLLSDNRHYAFYLWRWFLGRKFLRILGIPCYLYAAWTINDSIRGYSSCTFLWRAVYVVCVAVTTVPQRLFEFRYFIIPFLMFRLHVKEQRTKILLLELLFNVLINIATILIFLNKTFYWSDIKEPQRIMW